MPPRTAPPSSASGNRIPLYIALFVAVAALAIVGLRLSRSNAPAVNQPASAPAPASQQPFPSEANSKDKPAEQAPPTQMPPGVYNG